MLMRGLVRRCPRCGAGRLFRWWVVARDRCRGCGLRLDRGDGFMLGVIALDTVITSVAFAAYLVVGFVATAPDPPIGALTGGGLALCLMVAVAAHPVAKTLWGAIDLAMRPLDVVEEAEAATYLAALAADGEGAPSGSAGTT
jgi:uncharacterized protein (DUF983 family)